MGFPSLILLVDAALVMECGSIVHAARKMTTVPKPKCIIYNDEPLHIIMDRVCEICHEMYSHLYPNMRANCSDNVLESIAQLQTLMQVQFPCFEALL
ncbi:unnamed protein product [Gongylonema pulchrum]|uniref:Saposin B-type domain-containing protein n=1 Tax=Gongylonema pulchrum TaxID=637853 RepID=A0A183CW32_9BILA|nr:unnamed protein product [Gongylonema pulchrum]